MRIMILVLMMILVFMKMMLMIMVIVRMMIVVKTFHAMLPSLIKDNSNHQSHYSLISRTSIDYLSNIQVTHPPISIHISPWYHRSSVEARYS